MREKKDDRRILRTRALLRRSLVELMAEKDVNSITVRELVERVDVNRSTFYLHYTDIYDLLLDVEQSLTNEVTEAFDAYRDLSDIKECLSFFKTLFGVYAKNRAALQVLIPMERGNFLRDYDEHIDKALRARINSCLGGDTGLSESEYLFFKSGFIGLIKNWILEGDDISPETMSLEAYDIIRKLNSASGAV